MHAKARRAGNALANDMTILVAYHSRNGHTGRMAKEIARRCGADVDAIRELQSNADSLWGRWRTHWQTVTRAQPMLHQARLNPGKYDLVVIGAPFLWLGLAPAVRSYVSQYRSRFKQVAFFCAEGAEANQRAFAELERLCGKRPVATFSVRREGLPPIAHNESLTDFMSELKPE